MDLGKYIRWEIEEQHLWERVAFVCGEIDNG